MARKRDRVGVIRISHADLADRLGLPDGNAITNVGGDILTHGDLLIVVRGVDMPISREGETMQVVDLAELREKR